MQIEARQHLNVVAAVIYATQAKQNARCIAGYGMEIPSMHGKRHCDTGNMKGHRGVLCVALLAKPSPFPVPLPMETSGNAQFEHVTPELVSFRVRPPHLVGP